MDAKDLLRDGDLDACLRALQAEVRAHPADAKRRVFLFQLLCVRGEWDRALTQLDVAAQLDSGNLLMAQVCRQAILCERLRADVFAGRRTPLVLGEPSEWIGWLIQANTLNARGEHAAAADLRARALDAAPATPGSIDGRPFEWIADADQRLGPVLEAITDGKYYWAPFERLAHVQIDPPADLRDVVWLPATFRWTAGGETFGLIPTRYPGSEADADPRVRLARFTDWRPLGEGEAEVLVGAGQRLLATDQAELAIMDVRRILLGEAAADAPGDASAGANAAGAGSGHG